MNTGKEEYRNYPEGEELENLIWLIEKAEKDTAENEPEREETEEIYMPDETENAVPANRYERIEQLCKEFAVGRDSSMYKDSHKLGFTLGTLNDDVYLAHDDTLFKTGKNGFAITKSGIYCREFLSSTTVMTTFEELAEASRIYINASNIYADNKVIAYMSISTERDALLKLFEQIAGLLRQYRI